MMKPTRCPGGTWQGTSACLMFVREYVLFFDIVEPRALAHLWRIGGTVHQRLRYILPFQPGEGPSWLFVALFCGALLQSKSTVLSDQQVEH